MEVFLLCAFWISLALVAYAYLIYPIVLFGCYSMSQLRTDLRYLLERKDRRVRELGDGGLPDVTFVLAAYNEEESLPDKITNLRRVDYPPAKLQFVIVSDGSTDSTNEILMGIDDPRFEVFCLPTRSGKAAALNVAVSNARHNLLVFSDASTVFETDAVRKLVRHFADTEVGVVCGTLRFHASPESQQTEGVYWKYESILRLMEGRLGATLTASGAIYALRRDSWVALPPGTVLDDFVVPVNARQKGYSVRYDPEATAYDFAPSTVKGEFSRRVRLAMGSFRSLGHFMRASMPGFTRFAFISHKLMRWIVPLFLLGMLFSNLFLLRSRFYQGAFIVQFVVYIWAGIGYFFQNRIHRFRFALLGYFIMAMNLAFLVGLIRTLARREITWQRVS